MSTFIYFYAFIKHCLPCLRCHDCIQFLISSYFKFSSFSNISTKFSLMLIISLVDFSILTNILITLLNLQCIRLLVIWKDWSKFWMKVTAKFFDFHLIRGVMKRVVWFLSVWRSVIVGRKKLSQNKSISNV